MSDGKMMVVGDRDAHNYEFIQQEGQHNAASIKFDFLTETTDKEENNLYPFVYLNNDDNVFIFSNNRAVLLNPNTNQIGNVVVEVLICGGSAHVNSYTKGNEGVYYVALQDYGRMRITDLNPVWKRNLMPSPRLMGDMLLLPFGEVLLINGAKRGSSGRKVLVAGSNTNNRFVYDAMFPTKLRAERFSLPYLDPVLEKFKPQIDVEATPTQLAFNRKIVV
ncbi:unnamed protein product [Linum tenue]|uniref:Glyoxal oxidase N-terminal domain-containing protein n=1 Tax=Linum tenue TaxID=586396 RepID=A0AAV0HXW7_9ROSI|nr:unnamed protein product [Linum tenue]